MSGDGLREAAVERLARRRCIQAGHDPDVPSIGPVWLGSPYWLEWSEEAAADIADHHALLDQRGFAVVPVEPTQDMLRAAGKADDESAIGNGRAAGCEEHWDAMLAAAPTPFAEAPDGQ